MSYSFQICSQSKQEALNETLKSQNQVGLEQPAHLIEQIEVTELVQKLLAKLYVDSGTVVVNLNGSVYWENDPPTNQPRARAITINLNLYQT